MRLHLPHHPPGGRKADIRCALNERQLSLKAEFGAATKKRHLSTFYASFTLHSGRYSYDTNL
jgi:hypothetical protein